jgi:hypothetical protein
MYVYREVSVGESHDQRDEDPGEESQPSGEVVC